MTQRAELEFADVDVLLGGLLDVDGEGVVVGRPFAVAATWNTDPPPYS